MIKILEKNKTISLIITCLVITEIFYFSSLSFGPSQGGFSLAPIIYHFIIFFLLSFFIFVTIVNKNIQIKHLIIVFLISISYAILDEIHQLFVPFRSSSIQDILTDSAGIFSSIIIYLYYKLKNKNIRNNKNLKNKMQT